MRQRECQRAAERSAPARLHTTGRQGERERGTRSHSLVIELLVAVDANLADVVVPRYLDKEGVESRVTCPYMVIIDGCGSAVPGGRGTPSLSRSLAASSSGPND